MILVTANQLLAHLIGDYTLQSDWMARTKKQSWMSCSIHALFYTLPFLFLIDDISGTAMFWIWLTHLVIDKTMLVSNVIRLRNMLGDGFRPWRSGETSAFGMYKDVPQHVQFFVFVLVDNTLHILCNAIILSRV